MLIMVLQSFLLNAHCALREVSLPIVAFLVLSFNAWRKIVIVASAEIHLRGDVFRCLAIYSCLRGYACALLSPLCCTRDA